MTLFLLFRIGPLAFGVFVSPFFLGTDPTDLFLAKFFSHLDRDSPLIKGFSPGGVLRFHIPRPFCSYFVFFSIEPPPSFDQNPIFVASFVPPCSKFTTFSITGRTSPLEPAFQVSVRRPQPGVVIWSLFFCPPLLFFCSDRPGIVVCAPVVVT